jgi:hypothetical protein
MLTADERLPYAREYVGMGMHFVVHAPRQTGKTTALIGLARELHEEGGFVDLRVSCEAGEPFGDDFRGVEELLLEKIRPPSSRSCPSSSCPLPTGLTVHPGIACSTSFASLACSG